ncbi:D-inositol-3-phosphate glycosyltransferase [compost metagenome]
MKIAHLTSAHPRYDIRIFLKECQSLARSGYSVHLVVADGKGDELKDGISVHDVAASVGRIRRMILTTWRVYEQALRIDAEIYHLHDPELLPIGLMLKLKGKKVIFDAHEDLPKQIMGKPYLNEISKQILSRVFSVFESLVCRRFDAVVTATPWIADKFIKINPNTVVINNYPMVGELSVGDVDWSVKRNEVSYIGGITSIRGISQVVSAMARVKSDVRLQLGGRFSERAVEAAAKSDEGWARVDELGFVSREDVRAALARSVGGLVTFLPAPNHLDAQPNKMFEYMSAGVPVIASDFPLWREIIEGNQCGLCVDPEDPVSIAKAIDYLVTNPSEAAQMGLKGQKAVSERYNWDQEERKLIAFYSRLWSK